MSLKRIMTEPEYRQVEAISYSMLAGVDKTPASLINKIKIESPSLTYGSAVDTLAFDGSDVFNEKFIINSGSTPTKPIQLIVDDIVNNIVIQKGELVGTLDDYDKQILVVAKTVEYGKGWNPDTIIRKVKDEGGRDLFSFKKESAGKLILDSFEYQKVINSVNTLFTHPFTRHWINEDMEVGYEVVYQFPILWTYKGRPAKCLFDIIGFDHAQKIIYPIDLKTSYDHVLAFPTNFLKWKYYVQSSLYSESLKYWKLDNPEYMNYRVDNFRFMIISSQDPFIPLMYKCTDETLYAGKNGGKINFHGNIEEVRGFDQLIDDMEWHLNESKFDYPKRIYDVNGELELDVFV